MLNKIMLHGSVLTVTGAATAGVGATGQFYLALFIPACVGAAYWARSVTKQEAREEHK